MIELRVKENKMSASIVQHKYDIMIRELVVKPEMGIYGYDENEYYGYNLKEYYGFYTGNLEYI